MEGSGSAPATPDARSDFEVALVAFLSERLAPHFDPDTVVDPVVGETE